MDKSILNHFGACLHVASRTSPREMHQPWRHLRVAFALVLSFFYCHAHHVWQEHLCSPSSTLCAALVHLDLDASDFYTYSYAMMQEQSKETTEIS